MDAYQVNPDTDRLVIPEPPPTAVRHGIYTTYDEGCEDYTDQASREEKGKEETRTYWSRFYILIMFSLLTFTQGGVWNTWGPITQSSEKVFGWQDQDIALLANWGPITYIISTVFFTWLMDVKGLRCACLVTAVLVAAGCGLRCITPEQPYVTWLMHAGQFLNGLGGPVAMGGPPLVSAVWFPVHERTTATAFSAIMNGFGVALSFIIGPIIVPSPQCLNGTTINGANSSVPCNTLPNQTYISVINIPEMKAKIMHLMYGEFALSAVILLMMVVYFPSRPPMPPSITASKERTDFKQGLFALFRHVKFWMLGIPYALSSGVYNCWSSVLDVNLKPLQVSEENAGWIGFWGTIAGNVAGIFIARGADIFTKRMKLFLLVLYVGAVLMFGWFAVVCQKIIPMSSGVSLIMLYIAMIVGSVCISGAVPLYYELVCESCYPIAEGVTNGFLTWLNNVAGLLFLLVLMLKQYIGTQWMNWCLVGCTIVCIPILMMFKERYQRFDIDTQVEAEEEQRNEKEGNPSILPPQVIGTLNS